MSKFLTVKEFQEQVPISAASVTRRLRDGKIPFVRLGGRILIPSDFADRLLQQAESNFKAVGV